MKLLTIVYFVLFLGIITMLVLFVLQAKDNMIDLQHCNSLGKCESYFCLQRAYEEKHDLKSAQYYLSKRIYECGGTTP